MRASRAPLAPDPPQAEVDGVVLLDKPAGLSSHAAVQRVRGLFGARKAGHTGTLDPLATGLLPICLGEATKFAQVLLAAEKRYLATVRLGITTTTGDLEGEVVARREVAVRRGELEEALRAFEGEIEQVPPMYSAVRLGGRRLYELARAGQEAPRAARRVHVRSLTLVAFDGTEFQMHVVCGKGTYVRALAEDIGSRLGCGACLAGLRRLGVGAFDIDQAVRLERLASLEPGQRARLLLGPDALLAELPRLDLDAAAAQRLRRGGAVALPQGGDLGPARVYGPDGEFLGLAELRSGRLVPRRLRAQRAAAPTIA